jgi:hypothetical protein
VTIEREHSVVAAIDVHALAGPIKTQTTWIGDAAIPAEGPGQSTALSAAGTIVTPHVGQMGARSSSTPEVCALGASNSICLQNRTVQPTR